jgi:hypothetical protein
MSDKQIFAVVLFVVAAILAAVASFVPPVQGRLVALAVGFAALGAAVQVSG